MKKLKRGLSGVVTVMILIGLTVAAVSIVWVVVNNIVSENLGKVGSCTDILGKVQINDHYTCYDYANDKLLISISIGDIDIDEILVSVSAAGSGESFTLTKTGVKPNDAVVEYSGGDVKLPGKNGGKTYNYSLSETPDFLEISPKIGGNQCGATDSLTEFPSCSSLV